jgi:hypothetical protein
VPKMAQGAIGSRICGRLVHRGDGPLFQLLLVAMDSSFRFA